MKKETQTIEFKQSWRDECLKKLKGSVSRENADGFLLDKLPFGAVKISAKEKP